MDILPTPDKEQAELAKSVIHKIGVSYNPDDLDDGLQNDHAWMIFDELCMDIYVKDGGKFHDENPPMPIDEKQFEGCVLTARHFISLQSVEWNETDYIAGILAIDPDQYEGDLYHDACEALGWETDWAFFADELQTATLDDLKAMYAKLTAMTTAPETVSLIVASYDWECPHCSTWNTVQDNPEKVICGECGHTFIVDAAVHIGK